jgi:hypothetical protein
MHTYEVRPRTDHRGVDLISDALQSAGNGTANRTQPIIHRLRDAQQPFE